jgi:hypothetical protein
MKLTLLCESCHTKHFETRLATFELDDLKWPMDLSIFKSHAPHLLPDPFPVGLEWEDTRCRQCRSRPFLNFIPQHDGTVMLIDGNRTKKGSEGRILTVEKGYIPIPGYPGGDPLIKVLESHITDADGNFGTVVEQMDPPGAPPSETDNGPFQCLVCGKCYKRPKGLAAHKCKGA